MTRITQYDDETLRIVDDISLPKLSSEWCCITPAPQHHHILSTRTSWSHDKWNYLGSSSQTQSSMEIWNREEQTLKNPEFDIQMVFWNIKTLSWDGWLDGLKSTYQSCEYHSYRESRICLAIMEGTIWSIIHPLGPVNGCCAVILLSMIYDNAFDLRRSFFVVKIDDSGAKVFEQKYRTLLLDPFLINSACHYGL